MDKVTMYAGETRFVFKEAEWEYLDALECGEDIGTVICIGCYNSAGREIASYRKEYESRVNDGTVNSFINKFMSDADFRKQFLVDGNNVTETMKNDSLINVRCEKAIQRINSMQEDKLKFRDYADLKTYGRDKVSGMKPDSVIDALSKEDIAYIGQELTDEKVRLSAMRWRIRGLLVDKSIRKAKVDAEIAENALSKYSKGRG